MASDNEIRDALLKLVPSDSTVIGNKSLFTELKKKIPKLDWEGYWRVRNELIQDGILGKGRGKGGAVYTLTATAVNAKKPPGGKKVKEQKLYDPFIQVLKDFWVKDNDIEQYLIEKTANQGKRKTRGKWTRPDVTLISIQNFQYIYGKSIDIITFEVKPQYDFGVESVFETAAHSVFAHKSYLCIHATESQTETDEFERITRQCELFGVGLMTFEDVDNWETYEIRVDARRREPDPSEANLFIKQQISEKNKEKLATELK